MKLGTVSLWRDSMDEFIEEVELAEQCGLDLIGVGDTQSLYREVYVSLALAATRTTRAMVGPMVSNPVTRHPAVSVSAIATVDALSDGRAVFGIGTGGSAVWAIEERPARLADFEHYLRAYRSLMGSGVAEWNGKQLRVDRIERPVPLVVSAEGPRTLQLAGALADGIMLHTGTSEAAISWCREHIAIGAAAAGRDPAGIELWMMLKGSIADDPEQAITAARAGLAGSARHALARDIEEKGVPAELLEPVRRLVESYDATSHAQAVSQNGALVEQLGLTDFLAEQFGLIGTPAECARKLRSLESLGIAGVLVPAIAGDPLEQIERLGRKVRPLLST